MVFIKELYFLFLNKLLISIINAIIYITYFLYTEWLKNIYLFEESIVDTPLVSLHLKNTNNAKSKVRFV
jgi:hypothetical protein